MISVRGLNVTGAYEESIGKCHQKTSTNNHQFQNSRRKDVKGFERYFTGVGVPHGSVAVSTVHASIWPYLPPLVFFHRPSASIHCKLHPRMEFCFKHSKQGWYTLYSLPLTTADSLVEPVKYHGKKNTRIIICEASATSLPYDHVKSFDMFQKKKPVLVV